MERKRLIKHAAMLALYIGTTCLTLHPEVKANETIPQVLPTTVLPEGLAERYRNWRLVNHQPKEIPVETSTPTPIRKLSSVGTNISPITALTEPKAVKTLPQRLPSTYEEAQEFIEEEKRIKGKVMTSEGLENALQRFSPLVQCAVRAETTSLNPYAIGALLELGPGQLYRFGKLITFYKKGYDDPFDYEQVLPFMEKQFALGDATHWAGPRDGKC
ncbi:MAG: hypothetical protein Q8P92_03790 [Candidatus Daviesbacteria bacterium]|nr:hypothetical protein [Candidatus Daviesbacteria bacterium]